MVFRESILELKRDFQVVSKYFKYLFIIAVSIGFTIFYNFQFFKLEKDIITLREHKSELLAKNMQLKEKKAVLSSPERIYSIASKKLDMKKVDLHNVHFIKSNE